MDNPELAARLGVNGMDEDNFTIYTPVDCGND
jgi:hypothetical protein